MNQPKTFLPAFTQAMQRYQRIEAQHGEDSEQARDAFTQAMLKAPDWFKDEASQIAVNMGMIPAKPSGYSDEGEPLYTLQDVARTLGISDEEAEAQMHKLIDQRRAVGLPVDGVIIYDDSNFNRRQ